MQMFETQIIQYCGRVSQVNLKGGKVFTGTSPVPGPVLSVRFGLPVYVWTGSHIQKNETDVLHLVYILKFFPLHNQSGSEHTCS